MQLLGSKGVSPAAKAGAAHVSAVPLCRPCARWAARGACPSPAPHTKWWLAHTAQARPAGCSGLPPALPACLFIYLFLQLALIGARALGKSEEFLDFSECCELLLFSGTYFLPYLK